MTIQIVIYLCVSHLKSIQTTLKDPQSEGDSASNETDAVRDVESDKAVPTNVWTQEETEKMLQFVAKVKTI